MNSNKLFAAILGASLLFQAPAASQSLDVVPSYHPDGPDANYIEAYYNEPVTLEVSLPGLDHEASQAASGQYLAFVLFSDVALPAPLPIGPTAQLWLNPAKLQVVPVPPGLTIPLTLAIATPTLTNVELPFQVATVNLLTPGLKTETSDLIRVNFLQPLPDYQDEMIPEGSMAGGTSTVTFDAPSNRYLFRHDDGQLTEYVLDLNDQNVSRGTIEIFESQSGTWPVRNGGFYYTLGAGDFLYFPIQFEYLGTHTLTSHSLNGNTVVTEFEDVVPLPGFQGTITHHRRITYTLVGKSLKIHGEHLDQDQVGENTFYAFALGDVAAPFFSSFERVIVPYMDQIGVTLINNQTFVSTYLDLFQCHGQYHETAIFNQLLDFARYTERAIYYPFTDGKTFNVDETGWVTVSDDVRDCFVHVTQPKSDTAAQFEPTIAVAFSRETDTVPLLYPAEEATVDRLVDWGMNDVTMWKVHWQSFGQNRRSTTHLPPNAEGGNEHQFGKFIKAATDAGWKVAMYTDFYSLDQAEGFDDNPNYSEQPGNYKNFEDGVKDRFGEYRRGFGLAVDKEDQSAGLYHTRLLSPKRSSKHFAREGSVMKNMYGINANYFDVMTITTPDLIVTGAGTNEGVISGDVRSPNDRTIRDAINSYKYLFRSAAALMEGPIVAEGGFFEFRYRFDSMYAGYLDGAWRTLATGGPPNIPGFLGKDAAILPDYEIQVVRPKMPGLFGMGQYPRFFKVGDQTLGFPYFDFAVAEYRATEISYGHNGYFMTLSLPNNGQDFLWYAEQIKEYYTFRALQDEWSATSSATVEYGSGGSWMDLTAAIKSNYDFKSSLIRVTYDTGLEMVVNHQQAPFTYKGYEIPLWGWVIENPNTGYLNISVTDTATANPIMHVIAPTYEFGDGNGLPYDFGGLVGVATDLKLVRTDAQAMTLVEEADRSITKL